MSITFQGNPMHLVGAQLIVGSKAPNFTDVKPDLTPWSLSDAGNTIKIISAVPSLDTGVCQIQTKRFNKEAAKLNGVTVITVSLDLPFAQSRWCGAEGIKDHIVISDYQERDFGKKYGTLIEELKLLTRSVFVLDKDNTVKYVEYVSEVTNEPNYEAAIKAVKDLM